MDKKWSDEYVPLLKALHTVYMMKYHIFRLQ